MSTASPSERAPRERCNCFLIRSLSRKITQLYDDVLAPSGLRGTQFSLMLTARKGLDGAPASVSALADRLNTDRTTLTRNLRILQAAGHIELVAGRDARSKCVQLTPAGEAALSHAQTLWREAQREVRTRCGDDTVDQFQQLALTMLPRLGEVAA
ncbi:MarR family transcriptional regulator [Comamonas serinivorans]|uniref:MarR family transcriptional regulator n=1 Tax=Comamonas serinivorans TaxID=1082851 RepID=A0A1Y0ERF9_9BURK|nr:helix-turn-helix domain-containing protein [Comamonas serinivorans]ARU06088.1 MarR family transcriptional regulator [Comamonas serinivorans]